MIAGACKLNVGSGIYPTEGVINFDVDVFFGVLDEEKHLHTDVVGRLQDIANIFPANFFAEIMSVHVIEHLYRHEVIKFLEDSF